MFVSFISYTTGVTCGAGTVNPFGAPDFNLCFYSSRVVRSLVFRVMICRSLFVLCLLAIVLSVCLRLRLLITSLVSVGHCIVCLSSLTTSDYPFGIFKLVLLAMQLWSSLHIISRIKSKSNTKNVNIVYKKVEDTKVVISSRKSKKDMQYNDQKKKYKI